MQQFALKVQDLARPLYKSGCNSQDQSVLEPVPVASKLPY
jgi:hypothetical protein